MADFNAYVTTDAFSNLTASSEVHVGGATGNVPGRSLRGFTLAGRINQAVQPLGWRIASGAEWDASRAGKLYFHVVPKQP
jgi:hypothetical protein